MREIKFRAVSATGELIYGLPYTDGTNETAYYKEYSNRLCWRNESGAHCNQPYRNGTLMQFTGLLDKQGVEIYEGDVVKIDYPRYKHTEVHKVTFGNVGWEPFAGSMVDNGEKYEVIGNIYENPELLKGEK